MKVCERKPHPEYPKRVLCPLRSGIAPTYIDESKCSGCEYNSDAILAIRNKPYKPMDYKKPIKTNNEHD